MDKSSPSDPSDPLRQRNSDVESGSINGMSGTKEESDDSLCSLEARRSVGFDVVCDVLDTGFDSAGEEAVSGCDFSLDCRLTLKADSTYEGEMIYGA